LGTVIANRLRNGMTAWDGTTAGDAMTARDGTAGDSTPDAAKTAGDSTPDAAKPAGGPSAPSIWMRPERAALGRPPQHSRAEITAVAVAIADRDGLDAVSMRRVAAQLGTGAASLYRYVETRGDLLDLMTDAAGGEYDLPEPDGDWLAGLLTVAEQARTIMRRHPWLAGLVMTRPVIGPNGVALLEHVLAVLAGHPADIAVKLEAFAMLNGIAATFVEYELAGGSALQARNVAYLRYAAASGLHPRLAQLLARAAPAPAEPADRYASVLRRILTGLLGPGRDTP
jgi:AcrR family transcriptional regulator